MECAWYIVFTWPLHLAALGAGAMALALAFPPTKQPREFLERVRGLAIFLAIFLVVGALFNGLWSSLIYGRFYGSSNYVCGFLPYWPFTKYWMEMRDRHGELMEVPFHMHLVWLLFASATWGVTIFVCRLAPVERWLRVSH